MQIGHVILKFESLVSTNSHASYLTNQKNMADGTVIVAGYQSGGRGQHGNSWESEPGKNLLASIMLFPEHITPVNQFSISMALSLGIRAALKKAIPDIAIKWPNDIYAGNDKIAGLLIEHAISGDRIAHTIAGFGLNVNQEIFESEAPNPVSMKMITGKNFDLDSLLMIVLRSVEFYYLQAEEKGRESIEKEYLDCLYRRDEWHLFREGEREFIGMITGIDEYGCLVISDKEGLARHYGFKEIEYL